MSKLTHYFDLNVPKVEHHMVSESDALTITAQASAGDGETFLASKNGKSNHVAGFKTGEDKILVPLDLLKEINSRTDLAKGALPAGRFGVYTDIQAITIDDSTAVPFGLYFATAEQLLVFMDDERDAYPMIALDGAPALAAADIEII